MGKRLDKAYADAIEDPGLLIFYAQDDYHHSKTLRINVGNDYLRAVEEVVSSREFGYRTDSDFHRDAGFHRLAFLAANAENGRIRKTLGETCRAMKRMHLLNALAASRREATKWLEDLSENMNDPRTTERQKAELVADMYDTIMSMSVETEEREIWLKQLKERYEKYVPKGFTFNRRVE